LVNIAVPVFDLGKLLGNVRSGTSLAIA